MLLELEDARTLDHIRCEDCRALSPDQGADNHQDHCRYECSLERLHRPLRLKRTAIPINPKRTGKSPRR